ncbi:MAG TPA: hypothetical protein VGO00_16875 [Kofleriaceae bacterium]|nr:hypothetical protein [Kofleriaceae bacterium]
MAVSPAKQLDGFIAKFSPDVAKRTREVLAHVRKRVPGALELVYDNYNALAIGFAPTEKARQIVFSIAVYPRWVSMFFMKGPELPDPGGLLQGSGSMVRHIVLDGGPATLRKPAVAKILAIALAKAEPPIDPKAKARIVIKSISNKQRPRRPAIGSAAAVRRRARMR